MLKVKFISAIFVLGLTSFGQLVATEKGREDIFARILPKPENVVAISKQPFVFTENTKIVYEQVELKQVAQLLAFRLGINKIQQGREVKGAICLILGTTEKKTPESYDLKISNDNIFITAQTLRGMNWGMQTLFQMLPEDIFIKIKDPQAEISLNKVKLPACLINDQPRFDYRGMHLDVCRHFFSVEEVKRFLDWMATYKLNTFHWHLTEDQGWRIEIKKYPLLTKIGAKRSASPLPGDRENSDNTPYGPFFYTQEQIREVVAYASLRGIEIIPEIEMPGHAQAALAAYPELGCTGGPYQPWTRWGVSDNVFCAGDEKVFTFLQNVIDEVIALFPGKYIHIGGDECPKDKWRTCPKCRQKAQELQININELQGYFMTRMVKYIESKNRHVIGWDELLDDGDIPKETMIMAWRGVNQGYRAAKRGFRTVMTPNEFLYFDYAQSKRSGEPETIGGICTIEGLYSFDPNVGLAETQKHLIAGLQANCWSEYFFDFSCVEYAILPRMTALAEVAWTQQKQRDFKAFQYAMLYQFLRFDSAKANLRCVPFDLGTILQFENSIDIDLELPAGIKCFMTIDGSEPTAENHIKQATLTFTEPAILKYYFLLPSGKRSQVLTTELQKLTFQKPKFMTPSAELEKGLKYQFVSGSFQKVANIPQNEQNWKVVETLTTRISGTPRNMVGFIFKGYFEVKEAGVFTIENSSDDGSVIWINQQKVIDNDGLHGAAEISRQRVALEKGWHEIEVKYFDAGGGASMDYRFYKDNKLIKLSFVHQK